LPPPILTRPTFSAVREPAEIPNKYASSSANLRTRTHRPSHKFVLFSPFSQTSGLRRFSTELVSDAETIGRGCLGMELEPRYVDVAVRRWQAFTGRKAVHLVDGRPFDVAAAERLNAAKPCGAAIAPAHAALAAELGPTESAPE